MPSPPYKALLENPENVYSKGFFMIFHCRSFRNFRPPNSIRCTVVFSQKNNASGLLQKLRELQDFPTYVHNF